MKVSRSQEELQERVVPLLLDGLLQLLGGHGLGGLPRHLPPPPQPPAPPTSPALAAPPPALAAGAGRGPVERRRLRGSEGEKGITLISFLQQLSYQHEYTG